MAHFNWPHNISPADQQVAENNIRDFMKSYGGEVFQLNVLAACENWEECVSGINGSDDKDVDYLCKMNGIFEVFRELRDKKLGLVDGVK